MPYSTHRTRLPFTPFVMAVAIGLLGTASCGVPNPTFRPGREHFRPGNCFDGARTDTETDVDCGGPCDALCGAALGCFEDIDCATGLSCVDQEGTRTCLAPHCQNQDRDEDESDKNCGGAGCARCAVGLACSGDADCLSERCSEDKCQPVSCSDEVENGTESDTDCGGDCTPCKAPSRCGRNEDCESKSCINGRCDLVCPVGTAECDPGNPETCETNVFTDPRNCGTCGNPCSFPHATAICSGGKCSGIKPDSCQPPFADCDGDYTNGCETDTSNTPTDCGTCRNVCPTQNGTSRCVASKCEIACSKDWDNCNDGTATDGCESNLPVDAKNCGGCGNACVIKSGLSAFCKLGTCDWRQCAEEDYGDCDGNGSCTNHFTEDPMNCGACGTQCLPEHGTGKCDNKSCAVATCDPGWGDCDGKYENGCETDLNRTTQFCSSCAVDCNSRMPGAVATCASGVCQMLSCKEGYGDCNGVPEDGCEIDLTSSPRYCGGCNRETGCAFDNAAPLCVNSRCQMGACDSGFEDCNVSQADGCEAELATDENNCNSCKKRCETTNATANVCTDAGCIATCKPGFKHCYGDSSAGCETALNTMKDCGACGSECSLPNTIADCSTGECLPSKCSAGFADCTAESGCETPVLSDPQHCGGCAKCVVPHATANCAGGICGIAQCDPFYKDCRSDSPGCETSVGDSATHCGDCNTSCSAQHITTPLCTAGVCTGVCDAGWEDGDGNKLSNGCERARVTLQVNQIYVSPVDNQINVTYKLCSPGDAFSPALNLAGWRLRYWFTLEGGAPIASSSVTGCAGCTLSPSTGSFPTKSPAATGASHYFDLVLSSSISLAGNGACTPLFTIQYLTNGNLVETSCGTGSCDYSYESGPDRVGLYDASGTLVRGIAP